MADGFLEKHHEEYEKRKADWLRKQRHLPKTHQRLERPDDEAL
ncbi:MAG: dehydrogenase [Prevotella sp.]|nr:dehydrogenase [Prevotella sp.]